MIVKVAKIAEKPKKPIFAKANDIAKFAEIAKNAEIAKINESAIFVEFAKICGAGQDCRTVPTLPSCHDCQD